MYSAADGSASPSADGFKRADLGSHPGRCQTSAAFPGYGVAGRVSPRHEHDVCLLRVLLLAWSVACRAPNSDLAFIFCRGFEVSVLLSWCWHWSRF